MGLDLVWVWWTEDRISSTTSTARSTPRLGRCSTGRTSTSAGSTRSPAQPQRTAPVLINLETTQNMPPSVTLSTWPYSNCDLDIIWDTYGHKNKSWSDFNRLPHVCPFPRSWAISHVACNCFTVYGRRNGRGVLTLQRHYVKYVLHWTRSWNSPVTEGKLSYHHHQQPVCGGQQPVTSLTTEESFE